MSHKAMDWAMSQAVPDTAAKLVLLTLAHAHNHQTGQCFPSIGRLVRETLISEMGVRRRLKALVELGLIEIRRAHDESGRQRANEYVLVGLNVSSADRPEAASVSVAGGYQR